MRARAANWISIGAVIVGALMLSAPAAAQRWRHPKSPESAPPAEDARVASAPGEVTAEWEVESLIGPPADDFSMDPYATLGPECLEPPFGGPSVCGPGMWNPWVVRRTKTWVHVDYLLWKLSEYSVPPLVSDAPNGEIPTLGANPNARILLGNGPLDDDLRSGARIRAGDWLDCEQSLGIEGHFFLLGDDRNFFNFVASGDGARSLGRPFFNVDPTIPGTPGEASLLIALDNAGAGADTVAFDGRVDVDTSSNLYSAGALLRHYLVEVPYLRIDGLLGYRFLRLDEGLTIQGTTVARQANPLQLPVGFAFQETDIFDTLNEFHGGELGLELERTFGDLVSLQLTGKVALGNIHQELQLSGANTLTFPGLPPVGNPGGLLVQPTNTGSAQARGRFERDEFAVLPEVNVNLGINLTRYVQIHVGWSFLYLDSVIRPGHQIDRVVNGSQLRGGALVGPARPRSLFNDSDLWLYGVNFGMEGRY